MYAYRPLQTIATIEFHDIGTIYRHDNVPDGRWASVLTFPKHCHDGQEDRVCESSLSDDPERAIREFLTIVRDRLSTESR